MAAAALRNVNRQRESPEPCALHRTRVSGDMRRVMGARAYRRCVCYPIRSPGLVLCHAGSFLLMLVLRPPPLCDELILKLRERPRPCAQPDCARAGC